MEEIRITDVIHEHGGQKVPARAAINQQAIWLSADFGGRHHHITFDRKTLEHQSTRQDPLAGGHPSISEFTRWNGTVSEYLRGGRDAPNHERTPVEEIRRTVPTAQADKQLRNSGWIDTLQQAIRKLADSHPVLAGEIQDTFNQRWGAEAAKSTPSGKRTNKPVINR